MRSIRTQNATIELNLPLIREGIGGKRLHTSAMDKRQNALLINNVHVIWHNCPSQTNEIYTN